MDRLAPRLEGELGRIQVAGPLASVRPLRSPLSRYTSKEAVMQSVARTLPQIPRGAPE